MATWWKWVVKPEIQIAEKLEDRVLRKGIERTLKQHSQEIFYDAVRKGYAIQLMQGRKEAFAKALMYVQRKYGSFPLVTTVFETNLLRYSVRSALAIRYYNWLFGQGDPDKILGKPIRPGGVVGEALSNTLRTIQIKPHPDFNRAILEYQKRARKGLAEVLVHRVSNVLSIVRKDLKNNPAFRQAIMQAASVSLAMYRTQSKAATKAGLDKRFGQLLLEWADEYKDLKDAPPAWKKAAKKYKTMAKGILPKPMPKISGGYESSTTRFIRMFGNPNSRINKATAWYRGVITGAAEGLISTASSSPMVDKNSKALSNVERHWKGAINHKSTPRKAKRQGWAELKGSSWNPKIEVIMRGNIPYKIFPHMITLASHKDAFDMREYITRKMNRGR